MPIRTLRLLVLAFLLSAAASCAPVTTPEQAGPPPAQNLLGTTDELQLVTELSLDLARQYGGERILVVLEADHTLLDPVPDGAPGPPRSAQPDAAEQLRRMQEAGLKTIALSARGAEQHRALYEALAANGLDFRSSAWPPQSGFPEPFTPEGSDQAIGYRDGILMSSGPDKGVMLKALLEQSGPPHPVLMVVMDRSQANLNEIMKEFSWTPTKVHAWRYTRGE